VQVAVLGSHREDLDPGVLDAARGVGRLIAERRHVLVTGASSGISAHATRGALAAGGVAIGVSPASGRQDPGRYTVDEVGLAAVIYTGMGYKGRNVITVRSADVIVVLHGGFGTLNEVAVAEGEGKPIIALTSTGGCAASLPEIFKQLNPRYEKLFLASDVSGVARHLDALAR
jgi:uncharacterized protein (TIGR00725 family)